jgi:hypothetical protein
VPIAELVVGQAATLAGKAARAFFQDWRDRRIATFDLAVFDGRAAPLTSTPRGALRAAPQQQVAPGWLAVEFAQDLFVDNPVLVVVQDARQPGGEGLLATDSMDGGLLFELAPGSYHVVAFVLDEPRDRLLGYGSHERLRLAGGENVTLTLGMTTDSLARVEAWLFADP